MTDPSGTWSSPDGRVEQPASASSVDAPAGTGRPSPPAYAPGSTGRRGRPVVPLRPLGLGELLDGSVAVLRRFPRPVFAVSAAVAVASGLLQLLLAVTVLLPLTGQAVQPDGDAFGTALGGAAVAGLLGLLLSTVASAVLTGFVTIVVSRAVLEQGITLREGWELLRPRLRPLLLTALALAGASAGVVLLALLATVGLASVLGAVGGVLGGLLVAGSIALAVWLYTRWSLSTAVVVLEKTGVRAALSRSSVLVRGDFWRVLGVVLLAVVIAAFVGQVLQLPFGLVGTSPLSQAGSSTLDLSTGDVVVASVAGSLAATVVGPFTAGVRALLYVDRRMRAEGLDVALVAAASAR